MNIKLSIPHGAARHTRNVKLEADYQRLSALGADQIFSEFHTSAQGLTAAGAEELLDQVGRNTLTSDRSKPWYLFLLRSFADEFIVVLLLLGIVSIFLNDHLGALIIFILAVISAMLRFVQDYSAYRSSQKLKTMIHTIVDLRRNGAPAKVNIEELVPGDVVELGPGSIIPADLYVIENKDLFLSQSMFTGESAPVEKRTGAVDSTKESTALDNICLMGCNVVSGSGVGVVVKTGKDSYLGAIAHTVEDTGGQKTNFEIGLASVTRLLVRYMIVVVSAVFIINGFVKHDWLQALLFSISVAVGITPGMLPMIVNATLSKGARSLARKKTIVKNISSIQNLGAIDVLCTDKTGTLTEDNIVLQRYINIDGEDDKAVLDYGYLNSYFSTGIKNLIDKAIISYGQENCVSEDVAQYKKVDEVPFDYERKRMSVVIESADGHRLLTKGALEEVIKVCTMARSDGKEVAITPAISKKITDHANALGRDGMHVIALAEKRESAGSHAYSVADEAAMTFTGYMAFLDPPKPDVAEAIKELYAAGVDVKVLTGDAPLVAQHICREVGMRSLEMLTGPDIEQMDDAALKDAAERTAIFARLAPMQKDRVVGVLRAAGHVVGYMGDGVNDAPSLRHADVGISVDTATDIAKESSDIILLEKSLMVVREGVYEGRRIYGNIMKYMKMALSSNFGNVFSVLIASILLPFLPMIPIQILIQNLIYDFTQTTLPWDNVDKEFLAAPKKWDTRSLSRFMNWMGITSSVFDVVTFAVLWFVFRFSTIGVQEHFQTGWFIEGLISQTLIVHFIRTSKIPFIQSSANIRVVLTTVLGIAAAIAVPYIFATVQGFNFVLMPMEYYLFLAGILLAYAVTIEVVKRFYIKRYGSWL